MSDVKLPLMLFFAQKISALTEELSSVRSGRDKLEKQQADMQRSLTMLSDTISKVCTFPYSSQTFARLINIPDSRYTDKMMCWA